MKQRVYEILYRELVENYANSKGRTNTADFWLTISAISFVYGLIICITGLATYIPLRISLCCLYRWRRIICTVHPVMLAEDYVNGKTVTRF